MSGVDRIAQVPASRVGAAHAPARWNALPAVQPRTAPHDKQLDGAGFPERDAPLINNRPLLLNLRVAHSLAPASGEPVRRPPVAHPIARRPLATLEQGERRPTGSRAAGFGDAIQCAGGHPSESMRGPSPMRNPVDLGEPHASACAALPVSATPRGLEARGLVLRRSLRSTALSPVRRHCEPRAAARNPRPSSPRVSSHPHTLSGNNNKRSQP